MFDLEWINNHFLYFSYLGVGIIFVLLFLVIRKLNKDIKIMDRIARRKMVAFMKKTSKEQQKKDKERKTLKF